MRRSERFFNLGNSGAIQKGLHIRLSVCRLKPVYPNEWKLLLFAVIKRGSKQN